jgi:hypothetical protein
MAGTGADDLWLVAGTTAIFHFDGGRWTQPGSGLERPAYLGTSFRGFQPLLPVGGGRAWSGGCAADDTARLSFWDGQRWTATDPRVAGCVTSIAGTSERDLWATSQQVTHCSRGQACFQLSILHYDGKEWSIANINHSGNEGRFFSPFAGELWLTSSDAFHGATIARFQDGTFRDLVTLPPEFINAVTATSASDIFMVGFGGYLAHFDGKTTQSPSGSTDQLVTAFSDGSDRPWVFNASGQPFRRDGQRWSAVADSPGGFVIAASGSSVDDFWVAALTSAAHWDGKAFTTFPAPADEVVNDVWVSPGGSTFLAGGIQGLWRAESGGFTRVNGQTTRSLWGSSETDVWLAVGSGSLAHFDGNTVTQAASVPRSTSGGLPIVRGTAADDVWAELEGQILHFDGAAWSNVGPAGFAAFHINVAGRNDVWAYATDAIWHFDGASWSQVDGPPGRIFEAGGSVFSLSFRSGMICRKP